MKEQLDYEYGEYGDMNMAVAVGLLFSFLLAFAISVSLWHHFLFLFLFVCCLNIIVCYILTGLFGRKQGHASRSDLFGTS